MDYKINRKEINTLKLKIEKYNLLLASKCMTISELSTSSGISTVTLRKLYNGKAGRPQTIGKIARALNVPVEELIQN